MLMLRKYIKVFILLVLPVYLILLGNSMSNMHIHVLSNGMVVRHAHPFSREQESKEHHHHSGSESNYYQGFFLNYFDTSEPIFNVPVKLYVCQIIELPVISHYVFEASRHYFLRGPPVS